MAARESVGRVLTGDGLSPGVLFTGTDWGLAA